jgi:phosphate transport system substrate-binding protein
MKNLIKLALFVIVVCLLSCEKDESESNKFIIDGITKSNYPKVDGSTSAQPLQSLIACKLIGITYEWAYDPIYMHYTIYPPIQDNESFYFIVNKVRNTGTHSSFINLINGDANIIIVAREASEYELEVARANNVNLIQTPIAIDAFIFILNEENPVNILSTSQIRGIYTGAINNWSEVGGINERITPYKRNATSGSQVLMETLIMNDNDMLELPEMEVSPTMWGPFDLLSSNMNGICYTVYYYKEFMARAENVKHISIDGVYPDYNTLRSREYPYTTNVYAVIRDDLDISSMAYSLYQLLLTRAGSNVIKESGYVPY